MKLFNAMCINLFSPQLISLMAITRQKSVGGKYLKQSEEAGEDPGDDPISKLKAGYAPEYAKVFEVHLAHEITLPGDLVNKLLPALEAAITADNVAADTAAKTPAACSESVLPDLYHGPGAQHRRSNASTEETALSYALATLLNRLTANDLQEASGVAGPKFRSDQ
jgi:hypothetical protein